MIFDEGRDEGLSGSVPVHEVEYIVLRLFARGDAILGDHRMTLYCGAGIGAVEGTVTVSCASCSPPTLIDFDHTVISVPQGQTKHFRSLGADLADVHVELGNPADAGYLAISNVNVTLSGSGLEDYIDLDITAAQNAPTGNHRVIVQNNNGEGMATFTVAASSSIVRPPANVPVLEWVSPSHISPGGDVFIECHGKGFGVNRTVLTSPAVPTTVYGVFNGEADPDSVVVAKIHPSDVGRIEVQVDNLDDNAPPTDEIRIFVDPLGPNTPVARNAAIDGVHRGGSYVLQVTGENLSGITNLNWSGIPGLTFSNTSATATSASVTVTAAATTPLSGNQATNLYLINGSQQRILIPTDHTSLPFSLNVLP